MTAGQAPQSIDARPTPPPGMTGPSGRGAPGASPGGSWWRWAIIVVAAGLVLHTLAPGRSGPPAGKAAPDFSLPRLDDTGSFHLASHRGTPVLVEVLASWCGACRASAPTLAAAARAPRVGPVQFVAVSVDDSPAAARTVVERWKLGVPVVHDPSGSFSARYGVTLLPTLLLIDAEGVVRRVRTGSPSVAHLEEWLAEVGAARRP